MINFTDESFISRQPIYVDQMYYFTALSNLQIAKERYYEIEKINHELSLIESYSAYVAYDWGEGDSSDFDQNEFDTIEEFEYIVRHSLLQYAQSIAAVHIFCVTSLESHINNKAYNLLKGKIFEQFERISLESKWLMLPKLVTGKEFDPGRQPYQDFSSLIKIRNALVHHKSKIEKRNSDRGPAFKFGIGLDLSDADKSIAATKRMIVELANMFDEKIPWWVNKEKFSNFLKFDI